MASPARTSQPGAEGWNLIGIRERDLQVASMCNDASRGKIQARVSMRTVRRRERRAPLLCSVGQLPPKYNGKMWLTLLAKDCPVRHAPAEAAPELREYA